MIPSKRLIDVSVAAIAGLITLPLMLIVAALVRLKLGSPVLFRQPRIGLHGAVFTLIKFRTMREEADELGVPRPDEKRLTPFGKKLRALSLDEWPTLLNVLRGDMSLVGPRPLLVEYRDLYTPEQWRRHDVLPGIAGPVQAWGRNTLTWDEKFALDVWYVDHRSLSIDIKILLASVANAIRRRDVSAIGHATMPRFRGTIDGDD